MASVGNKATTLADLAYFWAQMKRRQLLYFIFILFVWFSSGCANIVPPAGGKKDTKPPKLLSVEPADSLLNTRVSRFEMHFDEYITTSDVAKEVEISPILAVPPVVTSLNKHVIVKIPDSLLEENTTYRISFGNAIKDVHEGNPFTKYVYTFSTGPYFDSLQISGNIINAATGKADTGAIYAVLYSAAENDSAVVRKKPKYVAKADNSGNFSLKGLPNRKFRIYALKDANANLTYDGGAEMIGFIDRIVSPGDSMKQPITLRIFKEVEDTSYRVDTSGKRRLASKDSTNTGGKPTMNGLGGRNRSKAKGGPLGYIVKVDTTDTKKRTFDVTQPLIVPFNDTFIYNKARISLQYDSEGVAVDVPANIYTDTTVRNVLFVKTGWKDNTLYTLKLAKGFAKDTAGKDVSPGRFSFRTLRDEDYAKMQLRLPTKYLGDTFVVRIMRDGDSIYQKKVTDTVIDLNHLKAGNYTFRIIVDKNKNGVWDPGDLFKKIQPEYVIPSKNTQTLKAGWENIVDFEEKQKAQKGLNGDKKPSLKPDK